jgi:hypothetical protein
MANFSQEPWVNDENDHIVNADGRVICRMLDTYHNSGIEDKGEHYANAALIVKAPETYRSLKELCLMLKILRKQLPESELLAESIASANKTLEQVNKQIELAS